MQSWEIRALERARTAFISGDQGLSLFGHVGARSGTGRKVPQFKSIGCWDAHSILKGEILFEMEQCILQTLSLGVLWVCLT